MSVLMLMRLWGCPDLTSSPTNSDIHLSQIAGTQWTAFLTLIITLRTDGSLLSALDSRLRFPHLFWILFPWPSCCPVISEEMARYKGEDNREQGWGQNHAFWSWTTFPHHPPKLMEYTFVVCFYHFWNAFDPIFNFEPFSLHVHFHKFSHRRTHSLTKLHFYLFFHLQSHLIFHLKFPKRKADRWSAVCLQLYHNHHYLNFMMVAKGLICDNMIWRKTSQFFNILTCFIHLIESLISP